MCVLPLFTYVIIHFSPTHFLVYQPVKEHNLILKNRLEFATVAKNRGCILVFNQFLNLVVPWGNGINIWENVKVISSENVEVVETGALCLRRSTTMLASGFITRKSRCYTSQKDKLLTKFLLKQTAKV